MTGDEEDSNLPRLALSEDDLERIPEDIRKRISGGVTVSREMHMISSPLLPPAILEEYEKVVPGLSGKLVEWTEFESSHRREMEKATFDELRRLRSRGQLFGFLISAFGLLVAAFLGYLAATNSSSVAGWLGGLIAVVSVGGPFAARAIANRFGMKSSSD